MYYADANSAGTTNLTSSDVIEAMKVLKTFAERRTSAILVLRTNLTEISVTVAYVIWGHVASVRLGYFGREK